MIAILGGTFDPIHKGHLHIATRVLERLPVQQVQFMPCALPVHRGQPRAFAEQRCSMIELAIDGQSQFVLNRLEIERAGPSYTVDSLREMRGRDQDTRLALILGGDAYNGFAHWKQPDEILELAHLVVCRRPGVECAENGFSEHRVDTPETLSEQAAGAILMLDVDAPDCSSSRLRSQLAADEAPDDCLSPAVADYIETQRLYREGRG